MILMGDEIGRSQGGNNNSWCQNNLLGWMNWEHRQQDLELLEYFKYVIKIRKKLIIFSIHHSSLIIKPMKIFQHIIGMEQS